jgi:hypothetical protein
VPPHLRIPYCKGHRADSEEKREPASDINTVAVDSLKVLDPKRPIREADVTRRVRLPAGTLPLLCGSLSHDFRDRGPAPPAARRLITAYGRRVRYLAVLLDKRLEVRNGEQGPAPDPDRDRSSAFVDEISQRGARQRKSLGCLLVIEQKLWHHLMLAFHVARKHMSRAAASSGLRMR